MNEEVVSLTHWLREADDQIATTKARAEVKVQQQLVKVEEKVINPPRKHWSWLGRHVRKPIKTRQSIFLS